MGVKAECFSFCYRAGERNVWADMFSRWVVVPNNKISSVKVKAVLLAPITPGLDEVLDWPSLSDIKESQSTARDIPPKLVEERNGIVQDKKVCIGYLHKTSCCVFGLWCPVI